MAALPSVGASRVPTPLRRTARTDSTTHRSTLSRRCGQSVLRRSCTGRPGPVSAAHLHDVAAAGHRAPPAGTVTRGVVEGPPAAVAGADLQPRPVLGARSDHRRHECRDHLMGIPILDGADRDLVAGQPDRQRNQAQQRIELVAGPPAGSCPAWPSSSCRRPSRHPHQQPEVGADQASAVRHQSDPLEARRRGRRQQLIGAELRLGRIDEVPNQTNRTCRSSLMTPSYQLDWC